MAPKVRVTRPQSPGQRFVALRDHFGIDQAGMAKVFGIERPHLSRLENGIADWNAKNLAPKIMAGLGMTYEQVASFASGEMQLDRAAELSAVRLRPVAEAVRLVKSREKVLDAAWDRASLAGDLDPSTKAVAAAVFDQADLWGEGTDRLAKTILELNKGLARYIKDFARTSGAYPVGPKKSR